MPRVRFRQLICLSFTINLALSLSGPVLAAGPQSAPAKPRARVGSDSSKALQPMPLGLGVNPVPFKGDKWAVVIGISRFADSGIPALRYSAKDARDFYDYLVDPNLGRFSKDHVKLLVDEDATKVNIMDVLGDSFLPHAAAPGDLVVIYLSTHGSPSGADIRGVNYVVAHDSQLRKLFATGIEMRQLVRTIRERVHTNRIVLVLDTCYSGAGAEEAHKGLLRTNVDTQALAQGTGTLVLSSSAPDQRAWESENLKNSYFTSFLIDALRQNSGQVPMETAYQLMKEKVQSAVLRDKGQLQTPVLGGSPEARRFILGLPAAVRRSAPITVAFSEASGAASSDSRSTGAGGQAPVDLSDYAERMRAAAQHRANRKLWDAIHELQLAQKLNPTSIEAYVQASDILDEQGRFHESWEAAKRAVINADNSSEAHYRLGRANLRIGLHEEALRQVRTALSLDPGNAMAYTWLGYINEHQQQRIDEAEQNYRKALELDPLNVRAMVNLGLLLQKNGNIKEAESLFRRAIQANADDWEAHLALGYLFFHEKNNKKAAEKEVRAAIALDPANSRLHSELAQMLAEDTAQLQAAEDECRKGIELAPNSGLSHYVLADFLFRRSDRIDEAEKEYRTAISLDANLDKARVGLADLLLRKKTYDHAYEQYQQALKINPKNAEAHLGLAVIQIELYKNYAAAEQEIRKALAIRPKYSAAHDLLGVMLANYVDRTVEAAKAFEAAIDDDPKNADAQFHYAKMLIKSGKAPDAARRRLEMAIELNPQASIYKTTLAHLLMTAYKQYKPAEDLLRKAIESNVGDSEAHYRLGMLLIERFGRRKEGEAELKTALRQDPNNAEVKAAYERFTR